MVFRLDTQTKIWKDQQGDKKSLVNVPTEKSTDKVLARFPRGNAFRHDAWYCTP